MRVSVLGPLRVTEGGRALAIGGPRQRAVLAFLALHAGRVVPVERLVDELWGVPAPAGTGNALQAAVSRVRKLLPAGRLVTTPQGYLLRLTPEELDVTDFEQAFARGSQALAVGAAADAAAVLRSALALWRGPALVDFRSEPFAQADIARLEEARLACREARADADLAQGAGPELVAELQQAVADHPLREKLTGQLMLALYRGGRQAEALEAYRHTRDLLGEELGIDPSQDLVRLETAVLRQEPWLIGQPAASVAPPAPAPGSASTSSRRPVTVVCLDVVSAGGPGIDPEMLLVVGERVRDLVGPALERHGGRLIPTPGQRLLGAFGAVAVHEDDAQRAAASALECRAAVLAVPGLALTCRIGVATAEALVRDADPLGFVGEAVAIAQSLAEACEPGQVLVSDRTYRLAAGALEVEPGSDRGPDRGPETGSGVPDGAVAGPTDRHVLRRVRFGARSLPVRLEAPVLGRADELRRIRQACALARDARSTAFVTLVGDAGMGKTRLVHELARQLGDSARVATGRCLPYGDGVTFWPLRELVEQLAEPGDGEEIGRSVARVLAGEPDAAVVADRLARAFGAGQAGTSDTAEIFWATRRLLEAAGRRQLLVVVLEDLHWAEPTFLELVQSIALQPGSVPVLVLCVARPELLEERPQWLAAAATHVVVALRPLTGSAAAALADELARPRTLTADVRDRLVRAAGGNPFYLEQLVAAADEQPHAWAADDTPLPPTVQALLASRLDRLGPAEREVLAAAAVVGKDFGAPAVAALLPRPVGDRLPWHLRTLAAKALVQHVPARAAAVPVTAAVPGMAAVPVTTAVPGMVAVPTRSVTAGAAQHSFRHILVQQATYRAIPKAARAALHERLADWAEAGGDRSGGDRSGGDRGNGDRANGERADSQRVEILGHHLAQATTYYRELAQTDRADALARRATRYLQQAGNASLAIGDAAAAVRAFERTLALLPADDGERAPLLTGLGAALFETGRLADAQAVLDEALRVAAERGERRHQAHALVQRLLLDVHLDQDGALERVERALPDVRAAFTAERDDVGLCRAWLLEAAMHWNRARSADAERAWEAAAAAARAAGDRRHLTRSLRWLASAAMWGPTPARTGIARCRSYLTEIGSTPTGQAVIYLHLSGLHAMAGDLARARDARARGTAILREVGNALPLVVAEPAAFIAMLVEDFAAAERYLREAVDALRGMGEETDVSTCLALLARAIAVQGYDVRGRVVPGFARFDEAAAHVAASRAGAGGEDLSARIIGAGALARVLAARGEVDEAVATAQEAVELAAGTDLVNQHADALVDLAHVLRAGGREAAALAAAGQARTLFLGKENQLAVRHCDRFLAATQ